ncbi:MAG TPA: MFS transporter, partial [Nitrososphaeraceae archaeon]|nr:MFS transporter [Nitrososphaeraceae archaeon]
MKNVKINNINNDKNDRHPDLSNTRNSYLSSHRSIALSEHTEKSEKISSAVWKIVAILSLIATMVTYAETMLIPAIPDLIRDFHVSYNASSWLMTMYLVAGAVMTPIAGKLSDIYGRKKIL